MTPHSTGFEMSYTLWQRIVEIVLQRERAYLKRIHELEAQLAAR